MVKRIIVALIALAVLAVVGYRASVNLRARRAAENMVIPEKIVPVRTTAVRTMDFTDIIKSSGNVVADSEVILYSKVPGKIVQNNVKMGSIVTPGMTVAVVSRDEIGYQYNPFEVKSDVKGVVARVLQNPGALVGPATPLFSMVDIDTVKAVAAVDELKIRFVRMGQPVKVRLQAYPNELFSARVTNICPVSNPVSRTIEVEVGIPNGDHRIKPGMYAEAEFEQGRHKGLVLPLVSVVDRAGRKYVFAAVGGKASLKEVTTGQVTGDMIEILSGLDGSETIITTGADKLDNNDKITMVKS